MGEMNYVLDRLDFEEQIVRMIPKAENTSEQKNQSDTTSNTVRAIKAIKAIQSTIRPERCNQSNQSNMTSDTIRTNPGVVTITLPVALTRRLET